MANKYPAPEGFTYVSDPETGEEVMTKVDPDTGAAVMPPTAAKPKPGKTSDDDDDDTKATSKHDPKSPPSK